MANLIDYVAWRGDIGFDGCGMTEVDCMIFAELAYIDMDGIVPESFGKTVTVKHIRSEYLRLGRDQSYLINDPYGVLSAAAASKRFGGIRVGGYVNVVDPERQVQFSAVTFFLPDGNAFAAFRGTDNTLVGWREDFNMVYMPRTPGQTEAAKYLSSLLSSFGGAVCVGGHSKGGNLAVYAAAFCETGRDRVAAIYSFDGPGFNRTLVDAPEYIAVVPKVIKIIPDESLFGLLLNSRVVPTVVKSSEKGLQQHDPNTWEVMGASFVRAENKAGGMIDETFRKWCDSLTPEQFKSFCDALFDALNASGAGTMHELNSNKWSNYNAIAKALRKTDKTVYKGFTDSVKAFALSSRDVIWNETKRVFERRKASEEEK